MNRFFPWVNEISIYGQDDYAIMLLNYLINCIEADNMQMLVDKAEELLKDNLRGEVMTLAQQFEQKGIEIGMQQGIQQGMQQGIQKGIEQGERNGVSKTILAIKMLACGESLQEIHKTTNLPIETLEELQSQSSSDVC